MQYIVYITVSIGIVASLLCNPVESLENLQCGVSVGCFPAECLAASCTELATWANAGTQTMFTVAKVTGSSDRYLGLGFSADKNMGDDSVALCMMQSGVVSVKQSWNSGYSNSLLADPSTGLSATSGSYSDGVLSCNFTRDKSFIGEPQYYDLNNLVYVFFAEGPVSGGSASRHYSTPSISDSVNVSATVGASAASGDNTKTLWKAHGSIMTVAWMAASTIGIMLAMWYKPVWPNTKIGGIHVWFIAHRVLMVLTFLLTVISFIIIFNVNDWKISEINTGDAVKQYHPIFGLIVTILVMINPILPFFRCKPDDNKRWIFNVVHGFIGFAANLFAVVAIAGGAILAKDYGLSETDTTSVVYFFIGWCCIVTVLLTLLTVVANKSDKSLASREVTGSKSSMAMDTPSTSSTRDMVHSFKKILLVCHVIVSLSCMIAFIVLINGY